MKLSVLTPPWFIEYWQPSPDITLICSKLVDTAKSCLSTRDRYLQLTFKYLDKHWPSSTVSDAGTLIAAWWTHAQCLHSIRVSEERGILVAAMTLVWEFDCKSQFWIVGSLCSSLQRHFIDSFRICETPAFSPWWLGLIMSRWEKPTR